MAASPGASTHFLPKIFYHGDPLRGPQLLLDFEGVKFFPWRDPLTKYQLRVYVLAVYRLTRQSIRTSYASFKSPGVPLSNEPKYILIGQAVPEI